MPTWNGITPTPEEMARIIREAMTHDTYGQPFGPDLRQWQAVYDDRTAHLRNANNAINLIRCADGVYRPERKPMTGMWGFGGIGPAGGMFNTTGN